MKSYNYWYIIIILIIPLLIIAKPTNRWEYEPKFISYLVAAWPERSRTNFTSSLAGLWNQPSYMGLWRGAYLLPPQNWRCQCSSTAHYEFHNCRRLVNPYVSHISRWFFLHCCWFGHVPWWAQKQQEQMGVHPGSIIALTHQQPKFRLLVIQDL